MGIELDPDWPGLAPPQDEVIVDSDALIAFADQLDREAELFGQDFPGTPGRLRSDANVPNGASWFGRWETANDMEYGHATALAYVVFYYEKLVEQIAQAGAAARAAAAGHSGTDQAAATGFNQATVGPADLDLPGRPRGSEL